MAITKARKAAEATIDKNALYSPTEAVALARETSTTKFDATVDIAVRLGVDPRKSDQMVRGTVSLPHGTGKTRACSSSRPATAPRPHATPVPTSSARTT